MSKGKKTASAALRSWEKETEALVGAFLRRYFKGVDPETYWVSGEIGGVLCVNDYFFDLQRIIEAMRYKPDVTNFFEYADYELHCLQTEGKKPKIDFMTFCWNGEQLA